MKIEKLIYTNERGESVEFSHTSIYHTNLVTGLGDIRNTIYSYSSIGQDGDTYIGGRIRSREIEITGDIRARTKEDILSKRRVLSHILNPHLTATLKYQFGNFVRIIDCKVENAPILFKNGVFQGFTIHLLCLDPFWRETTESKDDIASWLKNFQFELEIPQETGIELGYREPSLIVNVYNGGDVQTGIQIDLRAIATVVDPKILNINTGEFIKFNDLTLLADDVLTISTHYGNKRITLTRAGSKKDAFKYLDIDSTYIQLALGDNLFRYEAEENAEGLEVSIYHTNKYLGV